MAAASVVASAALAIVRGVLILLMIACAGAAAFIAAWFTAEPSKKNAFNAAF
jgi:hypothetical protein